MKNLNVLIILCCILVLATGCNLFEDECGPEDFVGTYTLDVTTVTDDCNSEFSESITIVASGTDGISIDGAAELPIQGCSAYVAVSGPISGLAAGDKASIDGNILSYQKNTCHATYKKE